MGNHIGPLLQQKLLYPMQGAQYFKHYIRNGSKKYVVYVKRVPGFNFCTGPYISLGWPY